MGKQMFDQYTLLHFAIGIVAYFWDISLFLTTVLHIIFELLENTVQGIKLINKFPFWPGGKLCADLIPNQIGDTIGTVVGWIVAQVLDELGSRRGWYERHL